MQVWYKLAAQGKLNDAQKIFWSDRKPDEELYDAETDPDHVKNLAASPEHAAKLAELREALKTWIVETKDLGELSEQQLIDQGLVKDRLNTEYKKRSQEQISGAAKFPWPPRVQP
jgi:uncharacterized protein YjiS (DUF1127 family)